MTGAGFATLNRSKSGLPDAIAMLTNVAMWLFNVFSSPASIPNVGSIMNPSMRHRYVSSSAASSLIV